MPSRGSFDIMAVLSTTVSPDLISTAPLACSASMPVVTEMGRPATSNVFVTSATCEHTSTREAWVRKAELEAFSPRGQVFGAGPPETNRAGWCPARHSLSPEPEARDQRAIPLSVASVQVVQQPATLPDQQEQTVTRVVVLLVGPQVLGELPDPLGEDGNLDLGSSGVGAMVAVLLGQLCLEFAFDCQTGRRLYRVVTAPAAVAGSSRPPPRSRPTAGRRRPASGRARPRPAPPRGPSQSCGPAPGPRPAPRAPPRRRRGSRPPPTAPRPPGRPPPGAPRRPRPGPPRPAPGRGS